jgi:hypothetical protein
MSDKEIEITMPTVNLEHCEAETTLIGTINSQDVIDDRLRELGGKIRTDHLNDEERRSVLRICEDYNDLFHLPGDKLSTTPAIEHAIPTPSIYPCRGILNKNYRIAEAIKDEQKQITEQMLKDKIMRHSVSPWNSPIILVKKKEDASKRQKWRLVVDFRRLNDVTVGDSFPGPLIPKS